MKSGEDLGPLFDTPAPTHREGPATEKEAADRIHPELGELRGQIVALLRAAGPRGMIGAEICSHFPDRQEYSIRPRLPELAREEMGLAMRTKWQRRNSNGGWEMVWVATEHFDAGRHASEWRDRSPPRIREDPLARKLLDMAAQRWRASDERAVLEAAARRIG